MFQALQELSIIRPGREGFQGIYINAFIPFREDHIKTRYRHTIIKHPGYKQGELIPGPRPVALYLQAFLVDGNDYNARVFAARCR